ncbi:MAG: hypothetical protein LBB23_01495, partial [Rickettsiales bacterium]|nr:hypothetical protein [Rickettsiales bacterium]
IPPRHFRPLHFGNRGTLIGRRQLRPRLSSVLDGLPRRCDVAEFFERYYPLTRDYDHYPVRLRFATARHPFASEGDFCAKHKRKRINRVKK